MRSMWEARTCRLNTTRSETNTACVCSWAVCRRCTQQWPMDCSWVALVMSGGSRLVSFIKSSSFNVRFSDSYLSGDDWLQQLQDISVQTKSVFKGLKIWWRLDWIRCREAPQGGCSQTAHPGDRKVRKLCPSSFYFCNIYSILQTDYCRMKISVSSVLPLPSPPPVFSRKS